MSKIKLLLTTIAILILGFIAYYFYPVSEIPSGTQFDRIVVLKSKRELVAYANGKIIKTYRIALGKQPVGDKQKAGDNKTPEGKYMIIEKRDVGHCKFHRGLLINYPTPAQKSMGKTGSNILIHGLSPKYNYIGKFHWWKDWTAGCMAVTDEEIDQIFAATKVGTPVEINP